MVDTTFLWSDFFIYHPEEYKISDFLNNIQVIHYEVFVYDDRQETVCVRNRIFLGSGKYNKMYDIGKAQDKVIATCLFVSQYDYVYDLKLLYNFKSSIVFLCFKADKMYLVFLKDDVFVTKEVTGQDTLKIE